jgi:hypothetical protein
MVCATAADVCATKRGAATSVFTGQRRVGQKTADPAGTQSDVIAKTRSTRRVPGVTIAILQVVDGSKGVVQKFTQQVATARADWASTQAIGSVQQSGF